MKELLLLSIVNKLLFQSLVSKIFLKLCETFLFFSFLIEVDETRIRGRIIFLRNKRSVYLCDFQYF